MANEVTPMWTIAGGILLAYLAYSLVSGTIWIARMFVALFTNKSALPDAVTGNPSRR